MPVPLPASFVVKNGSNRCSRTSGRMPVPVSLTATRTYQPVSAGACGSELAASSSMCEIWIVSSPPAGIASRAFSTRFRTICSISCGSRSTQAGVGASTMCSVMSSRITRPSMSRSSLIV